MYAYKKRLLVMGALYMVVTLSLLVNPALRRMEKPRPLGREEGKSR